MKLWKWFFDDANAEEHDSGATPPEAGVAQSEADSSQEVDAGPEPDIEVDDYSEFDIKSPLLFAGRDENDTLEEENAEEVETPSDTGGQAGTGDQQVEAENKPYRTLKYHGQEIPVETEDDLVRLASQGLDYTKKTQQLAPYRALIDRINSDPQLMEKVVTLVQTGTLPELQQVQTAPQEHEPEEPNDDETWDEFIERRNQWREKQRKAPQQQNQNEDAIFMQRFNAALEVKQRQDEMNSMVQLTLRDPLHQDVLSALQTQLPPALLDTMNRDATTYRLVYDQIRAMIAKEPYFASLGRAREAMPPAQNNNVTPQQAQHPAPVQKPTQAVTLKGNTKAPYVEPARGQKAPGAVKKTLPGLPEDIWDLPDKEFSALVDKVTSQR